MSYSSSPADPYEFSSSPLIEQFCALLKQLPSSIAGTIEVEDLLEQCQVIQRNALIISAHLDQKKEEIAQSFDARLLPLAKDILADIYKEKEELKRELEDHLKDKISVLSHDWESHAQEWNRLYMKLFNKKEMIHLIIKMISERTNQLIDKDLKVIKEYQLQSLAQLSSETSDFVRLQDKLSKAIESPLKSLMQLKRKPLSSVLLGG
jgi:hypothetical protein